MAIRSRVAPVYGLALAAAIGVNMLRATYSPQRQCPAELQRPRGDRPPRPRAQPHRRRAPRPHHHRRRSAFPGRARVDLACPAAVVTPRDPQSGLRPSQVQGRTRGPVHTQACRPSCCVRAPGLSRKSRMSGAVSCSTSMRHGRTPRRSVAKQTRSWSRVAEGTLTPRPSQNRT